MVFDLRRGARFPHKQVGYSYWVVAEEEEAMEERERRNWCTMLFFTGYVYIMGVWFWRDEGVARWVGAWFWRDNRVGVGEKTRVPLVLTLGVTV